MTYICDDFIRPYSYFKKTKGRGKGGGGGESLVTDLEAVFSLPFYSQCQD